MTSMNADLQVEFLKHNIDGHLYVVALAEIRGEPAVLVVDPALKDQPSPEDVANIKYGRPGGKVNVEGVMRRVYPAVILEFVARAA